MYVCDVYALTRKKNARTVNWKTKVITDKICWAGGKREGVTLF